MNFFEQELRRVVDKSSMLADPRYIGRSCYGRVSDKIRARLTFVTMGYSNHYEALQITLINNTEGAIDSSRIRFRDLWEKKLVGSSCIKEDVYPYILTYNERTEWYVYQPTSRDYELLTDSVDEYLEMFSEDMEQGQVMT